MKGRTTIYSALTAALLLSATTGIAADNSGFLTDYSKLKPIDGSDAMLYTAPNAYTDFKNYKAVMIDQPEFVIANDSKYKGIKPDDAKAVADALRAQLSDTVTQMSLPWLFFNHSLQSSTSLTTITLSSNAPDYDY